MIKVANIIEEGRIGGPQRRIVSLASACANEISTTVIFPQRDSQSFEQLCKKNDIDYRIVQFSSARKNLREFVRYLFSYVPEVVGLWRQLKNQKYDLVHVSGGSWQSKGVIAARLARIPVIWHLNDTAMPKIICLVFSLFSIIPIGFIYSSHRTREYYLPYIRGSHEHEVILPAPVDTAAYQRLAVSKKNYLKRRFPGKIIVGTLANINPVKGIESIINIADKLKNIESQIEFVICGAIHKNQVSYYEGLLIQCQIRGITNISFLDFTDQPEVLMNDIDIYLCSSLAESSPTAVWEAMALAKPVVSFDVGDVGYQLEKADAGYLAPCGDVDELVCGLRKYIYSPETRKIDGRRLQKLACFELDIKKIAASYSDFCSSVANG